MIHVPGLMRVIPIRANKAVCLCKCGGELTMKGVPKGIRRCIQCGSIYGLMQQFQCLESHHQQVAIGTKATWMVSEDDDGERPVEKGPALRGAGGPP